MLADAIAAEGYKLLRNRGLLFWGFCAAPLGSFLFNLASETYLFLRYSGTGLHLAAGGGARIDAGQQFLQGLFSSTSFFFEIFIIAGAAALFSGEYRWESWRLVVPRNSRTNLLLAKFAIFTLAAAGFILAFGIFGAANAVYSVLLNGFSPSLAIAVPGATGVFVGSLAELMLLGAFVALIVTITRTQMAAALAGIFLVIVQAIGMGIAHPWEAPLRDFLTLPVMSAYLFRTWAAGQQIGPGVFAHPATVLVTSLILVLWVAVLGVLATVLFQRQDLSRE